jgi:hypothetical protein
MIGIDPACCGEVARGWRRVFCWGWISYDDIFGKAHRTTYCGRIRVLRINNDPTSDRLVPVFYDEHNCIDEQCEQEESNRPPVPPEVVAAVSFSTDNAVGWYMWLLDQTPETFEHAPDGAPLDPTPRDYYGVPIPGLRSS